MVVWDRLRRRTRTPDATLMRPETALPARVFPSPNHDARPVGVVLDTLILHYTGMPSAERALLWLADPHSRVSCHYLISEDGSIFQLVAENRRAWHAGASFWLGDSDINSRSIGIEIHNPGHDAGYPDFPPEQMRVLAGLCRDIMARWNIPSERVLAHSDIAPRRKRDPGERFDWAWLAAQGVGCWVEPAPLTDDDGMGPGEQSDEVRMLQEKLAAYGYQLIPSGVYDRETEAAVTAFQRHFRPARVDGRADRSTVLTLDRLIAAQARG